MDGPIARNTWAAQTGFGGLLGVGEKERGTCLQGFVVSRSKAAERQDDAYIHKV